jgi:hypothetical protein
MAQPRPGERRFGAARVAQLRCGPARSARSARRPSHPIERGRIARLGKGNAYLHNCARVKLATLISLWPTWQRFFVDISKLQVGLLEKLRVTFTTLVPMLGISGFLALARSINW